MIQNYINWEKKQIDWWKEKLGISEHGVAWISFIKGILVGLLVYHFFIVWYSNLWMMLVLISVDNSKKSPGPRTRAWSLQFGRSVASSHQSARLRFPLALTARCHVCLSSHVRRHYLVQVVRIVIRAIFLWLKKTEYRRQHFHDCFLHFRLLHSSSVYASPLRLVQSPLEPPWPVMSQISFVIIYYMPCTGSWWARYFV